MRAANPKLSKRHNSTKQMKSQLFIFALALLLPISSHAADQATQTRAHYAAVEKAAAKITPIVRDLDGYSGERGELCAYFRHGAPLKMVARHYFNTFRRTEELYFWQGRLFFMLDTVESYDEPISANKTNKVISREQNRYYFKNGKLWRWANGDGRKITAGIDFEMHEKEQLQFAREMLAGARGKDTTIVAPVH